MKSKTIPEIITALLLIGLAVLLLNPFHFWMPDMMVTGILIMILLAFSIFAAFVLNEKAGDEREGIHRLIAGRSAFLIGSAILMLGIVVQAPSHTVDVWIVLALVAMIIVKIVSRNYSDRNL